MKTPHCTKYLLLLAPVFCLSTSQAITVTWVGGTDDRWDDASNWDTNTVPTTADDVVFDGTNGTGTIDIESVIDVGAFSSFTVTNPSSYNFSITSGTGKLQFNGGTFASDITITNSAGGTDLRTNGPSTIDGNISIAQSADIRGNDGTWNGDFTSVANQGLSLNGARHVINGNVDLNNGGITFTSAGNNVANATLLNSTGNDWGNTRINFGGYLQLGATNAMPTDVGLEFGWHNDGSSSGTLDLNGNDQTVTFVRQTAVSTFANNNGDQNITGGGTFTVSNTDANTYEYHGRITDGASATSLTVDVGGTQILENNSGTANDYTGATTIDGGTLALNGDTQIDNSSEIAIASGATLDVSNRTGGTYTFGNDLTGEGSIDGDFMMAGVGNVISPGASSGSSIGNLSFTGDLATDANTVMEISLASGSNDSLSIANALGLNAGSQIAVNLDGGYTPMDGDTFDILDWGTITGLAADSTFEGSTSYIHKGGTFGQLVLPTLSDPTLYWDLSDFSANGVLTIGVPEPSSMLLCGLALLSCLTRRR